MAQLVCSNCRRKIAEGREHNFRGNPYGPKCFRMVKGEIPNTKTKVDNSNQDSLEDEL